MIPFNTRYVIGWFITSRRNPEIGGFVEDMINFNSEDWMKRIALWDNVTDSEVEMNISAYKNDHRVCYANLLIIEDALYLDALRRYVSNMM